MTLRVRPRAARLAPASLAARLFLAFFVFSAASMALAKDGPSRPPVKGCRWERISDAAAGLDAWVQRCDFGFRKIELFVRGKSLFIQYSDGGAPDPLVDVLELLPRETPEAGVTRIFRAHTPPALSSRCVLARYRNAKAPFGARFLTFVPDAAFQKELDAKRDPNEVPDPPCGEWGDAPDGIQYFEVWPGSRARKVFFVRVGQDEPLFDEKTLRPIENTGK